MAQELFTVVIEGSGQTFECRSDQSLLQGMERRRRADIPVGCRNGGCGICRVRILDGSYLALQMSRAQISEVDESARVVLACRVRPLSDIRLLRLSRAP